MSTLLRALPALDETGTGTVVVIGAGTGAPAAIGHVLAMVGRRLVLVEGDRRRGRLLARRWSGHPRVAVIEQAVTPAGGDFTWHDHGMSAWDGPMDLSDLQEHYPHVCGRTERRTDSLSLRALLEPWLDASETGSLTLVLDVPGQADALLASLAERDLQRLTRVLARGRGDEAAGARLAHLGFVREPIEGVDAPLRPAMHWRFDSGRHAQREALAQRDAAVRERDAARMQAEQLASSLSAAIADSAACAQEVLRLQAEHAESLAAAIAESSRLAGCAQAQEQQAERERTMLLAAIDDLKRQLASHQIEQRLAARREAEIDTLRDERLALQDALEEARAEAEQWRRRQFDSVPRASYERMLDALDAARRGAAAPLSDMPPRTAE